MVAHAGALIVALVLIVIPSHHQSFSFVFTKTINASGFGGHGFSSLLFWFVIGLGCCRRSTRSAGSTRPRT